MMLGQLDTHVRKNNAKKNPFYMEKIPFKKLKYK